MSGNSLVNLGELSKPATVLVEKISEAVGGVFKPYQIRRIARAEADAERIRAQTEIEVSDLQRRAVQRWLTEEGKKQENIEAITSKALPDVGDSAQPQLIEDDWITNFFDKARLISNDAMQALWSKVLAGEANDPGTYSKRTVNYLASLDSEDARLLTAVVRFCWNFENLQPIIFDVSNPIYADAGLSDSALRHLHDVGLLRFDYRETLFLWTADACVSISYFTERIELQFEFASEHNWLPIGHVQLSRVGMELAPLCGSTPVSGFLDYALRKWSNVVGLIPASPLPRYAPADRGEHVWKNW
jgi:hypothetical protein